MIEEERKVEKEGMQEEGTVEKGVVTFMMYSNFRMKKYLSMQIENK